MIDIPEIILIDKPKGITSFDIIRQLRKRTGIRKMGHAGTLDPLATGLMIIGVQKGTKQLDRFLKLSKVYNAEIRLGVKTDSGDLDGQVLEVKEVTRAFTDEELGAVLESFLGTHTFPVPLYSAIKVEGKPLYKYGREGKTPPRIPEKEMTVETIELLGHRKIDQEYLLSVQIGVSSGTYIRVLAEAIGKKLGYPASLQNLRRISIGEYTVEDAKQIDDF